MKSLNKVEILELFLENKFFRYIFPGIVFLTVLACNYLVFVVVPNEKIMGAVQRIFYFHVGAAIASYLTLALLFFGSVLYLATKKIKFDLLANAAASVSLLLCTIVLGTGMIWGHSAWNAWWRWEPRLVSVLILWLILVGYMALRSTMKGHSMEGKSASVLGILGAVQVPIVMFSVKLIDHTEQLHPQNVSSQGLADDTYVLALVMSIIGMCLLSIWLFIVRFSIGLIEEILTERGA